MTQLNILTQAVHFYKL